MCRASCATPRLLRINAACVRSAPTLLTCRADPLRWTSQFSSYLLTTDSEWLVGRDPSACRIVVSHPLVSSRHLLLRHDGSHWRAIDVGSTNGTWHNGSRITEIVVNGDIRLRLAIDGPEVLLSPQFAASTAAPRSAPPAGLLGRASSVNAAIRACAACAARTVIVVSASGPSDCSESVSRPPPTFPRAPPGQMAVRSSPGSTGSGAAPRYGSGAIPPTTW